MNEDQEFKDLAIDRREETVVTRHPGYAATEKVVRDVAAERRLGLFQVNRIMLSLLAFLIILLAFRFGLKMIGANPESGFAVLIYGMSGLFVAPFIALVANPSFGDASIEITTLIGMAVYALIFWGVLYIIRMLVDRPKVRLFTRITREQAPGDEASIRTTHTTISNGKL